MKIPVAKSGGRTIPLTPRAQQLLRDNLPIGMSSNAIRLAWGRLLKFYGIKDMHFHDLRHMALHNFANKKNISVSDCMIISGHKEPRTLLRIYATSRPKEIAIYKQNKTFKFDKSAQNSTDINKPIKIITPPNASAIPRIRLHLITS